MKKSNMALIGMWILMIVQVTFWFLEMRDIWEWTYIGWLVCFTLWAPLYTWEQAKDV